MIPENPKLPTPQEITQEIHEGAAATRAENEVAKKNLIKELTKGRPIDAGTRDTAHLSPEEQRILGDALRRSVRIIAP